ncbi:MAG: prepilin-type N-terminal cleavage/methylation domain-containing protein [Candidatus Acidiferrum sp.]
MSKVYHKRQRSSEAGMTLMELIISCAILLLLASAALPIARFTAIRERENELKRDLLSMRQAIDRYKDLADHGQIRVDALTGGYPPDLETLVKGVPLTSLATAGGASDKTIHFLRSIPVDPMTGQADWGLRSVEDDADSTSWGGQDIFDVYSKSTGTAMDGTKYSEW